MKKTNNYDFDERQRRCMLALVRDILSDKSVEQITFENAHGAISVRRTTPERGVVHAIGFTANYEDYDDYEESEE